MTRHEGTPDCVHGAYHDAALECADAPGWLSRWRSRRRQATSPPPDWTVLERRVVAEGRLRHLGGSFPWPILIGPEDRLQRLGLLETLERLPAGTHVRIVVETTPDEP